jgi:hypothetical protein
MTKSPAAKVADLSLTSAPTFWRVDLAAALWEQVAELVAKNLRFVEEDIRIHEHLRPRLATPEQVLDAARYLGAPADQNVRKTVTGGHIGLFMGARTLHEHWPPIARWIAARKH